MRGEMGYRLVVIEEERVPLAASPGNEYFWWTAGMLALILLLVALGIYLSRCFRYRKRIRQLQRGEDSRVYCGWLLFRLKSSVEELEAERVRENFENAEPFFGK